MFMASETIPLRPYGIAFGSKKDQAWRCACTKDLLQHHPANISPLALLTGQSPVPACDLEDLSMPSTVACVWETTHSNDEN